MSCKNYVKPGHGKNVKLCYLDTGSFIIYVKQMIVTKALQKMLKKDFTLQIMKYTDRCLKQKMKK